MSIMYNLILITLRDTKGTLIISQNPEQSHKQDGVKHTQTRTKFDSSGNRWMELNTHKHVV